MSAFADRVVGYVGEGRRSALAPLGRDFNRRAHPATSPALPHSNFADESFFMDNTRRSRGGLNSGWVQWRDECGDDGAHRWRGVSAFGVAKRAVDGQIARAARDGDAVSSHIGDAHDENGGRAVGGASSGQLRLQRDSIGRFDVSRDGQRAKRRAVYDEWNARFGHDKWRFYVDDSNGKSVGRTFARVNIARQWKRPANILLAGRLI